ncbi:ribosomal protein L36e-domain-containing protein [Xylaria sp. FL0933]|nr:ribosomal protein L36e-domain-containing protein [Xylaria sp. FL0933]
MAIARGLDASKITSFPYPIKTPSKPPPPTTTTTINVKSIPSRRATFHIPQCLGDQFYTSHLVEDPALFASIFFCKVMAEMDTFRLTLVFAGIRKRRLASTKSEYPAPRDTSAAAPRTVREVMGLAPYEKRVIELLRNSKDKRARKLAKKRLGSFQRGKKKVDELQRVIAESRRAH